MAFFRILVQPAFVASLAAVAGPMTARAVPDPPRPLIVATNTILADMVRQIAGPHAAVHCLVPSGVDIHGFEPRPADVAKLELCQLVVSNGAGFEPWLEKLMRASGYEGPHLEASRGVALLARRPAEGLPPEHAREGPHADADDHVVDPHAWQNPVHGIRYVLNIRDVLRQMFPAQRRQFEQRALLYVAQLEALQAWMRRVVATVPPENRTIVTSHDSFAYLEQAAGVEVIAVRGLDSRQEPDARQMARLIDTLKNRKVRAIFIEAITNPKMLEQLARDANACIGGELYSDSLGPPGSGADSYFGLLRENVLTIAAALERR